MSLFATIAPVAWGSSYYVTAHFLPPDRPLFAAAVRALPVGLALLLWSRRLPNGDWWWRAAVLGILNVGAFFPLIFLAAYHLPGGLAATLTATSPIVVMLAAWALIAERPRWASLLGAAVGITGVALLVLRGGVRADAVGVAASLGAVALSSLGYVLVKRWHPPVDMVTFSAWQLVAGGLVLLPVAAFAEGAPPDLDGRGLAGFLYICVIGTALANVAWFTGLRRMPAGAVSLIGLLNPVVGVGLGVALAGELFGATQAIGMLLVLGGILLGQPAVQELVRSRLRRQPTPPRLVLTGASALRDESRRGVPAA